MGIPASHMCQKCRIAHRCECRHLCVLSISV